LGLSPDAGSGTLELFLMLVSLTVLYRLVCGRRRA